MHTRGHYVWMNAAQMLWIKTKNIANIKAILFFINFIDQFIH